MKLPPKTPPELDRIVNVVLAYRPVRKQRKLREKKVKRSANAEGTPAPKLVREEDGKQ